MKEANSKMLVQILYSSFFISSYSDQEFSIPAVAFDLFKLKGAHQNELDEALIEFDGYSYDDVQDELFQSRKNRLRKNFNDLVEEFAHNAPKPIRQDENTNKASYKVEEISNRGIENNIIKKWFTKFQDMGGNKCFEFTEEDLINAQPKHNEIASVKILSLTRWNSFHIKHLWKANIRSINIFKKYRILADIIKNNWVMYTRSIY